MPWGGGTIDTYPALVDQISGERPTYDYIWIYTLTDHSTSTPGLVQVWSYAGPAVENGIYIVVSREAKYGYIYNCKHVSGTPRKVRVVVTGGEIRSNTYLNVCRSNGERILSLQSTDIEINMPFFLDVPDDCDFLFITSNIYE